MGCAFSCLFAACSLLVACALVGLRLNLTASIPVGIYDSVHGNPTRGSIVLVCLPSEVAALALERGYLSRGGTCPGGAVPVGKPILAMYGDTVIVTDTGLVVNSVVVPNTAALSRDRAGRLLPRLLPGKYPVGPGQLWLASTYSASSFDSRYFGPVDGKQVRRQIRELWTMRPRE